MPATPGWGTVTRMEHQARRMGILLGRPCCPLVALNGTEPLATDDQEDPTTTHTDGAEHHVASRAVRRCRMGRAVRRTAGHRGVRCDGRPGCHAVMGRTGASARRSGLPTGLPALRQPARCRGPHPGDLHPGVPPVQNYQPGTFEGWLHRITTNLFLDMVRRRGRIRMEALPEDYDRVPADEPNPEQIYHDAHLGADLQAALDSWRRSSVPRWSCATSRGCPTREIGATLGSSSAPCAAASTAAGRACATTRRPLG